MRILLLTSRLPYPPNRGDRSRVFHFIKHLSSEHELTLVSFIARPSEAEYAAALRDYCHDIRLVLLSRARSMLSTSLNLWRSVPLQALYYRSAAMQRTIDELLSAGRHDAVYVHLFRMAPYVANRSGLYRVVDLTDTISQEIALSLPYRGLAWRSVYRLEKPRIEHYEAWVARTFEETWLISQADGQILQDRCPGANIQVVPIGVDTEQYRDTGQDRDPNKLIMVGHMGVYHNVDAASHLVRDVLPLVRHQVPDCTLDIVGAEPNRQVRALAAEPAVTVTGFVPDLNESLNRAAVMAAPLRFCAGIQTKVLEAMASGTPVVTSSLVNRGLGARPGDQILVADDAGATAEAIVTLLRDPEQRARIGRAGREFCQSFRWDRVTQRMRTIEQTLVYHGQRTVPRGGGV